MLQEHENELEPQDKDLFSVASTKCDSQNINTYIDTDPYSYISDLIIQISKNITNRGLSQAGVNALFLSLLTGGLLYQHTVFPQTIIEFLKLYIIPILFLLYFIIDILKNIAQINNLYMRIFKGSDFTYRAIINDSISLYDLENCLQYKAFNSQQLIDIVDHLIKNNQFSPKSQVKLMQNTALYEVKSVNYIKDSLLEFEFTTKAVCIFLKKMEMRLDYKYLDQLIGKYGESPSVLFSVGKFHKYKVNELNPLYKLGCEFEYKKRSYDIIIYLISFIIAILGVGLFMICLVELLLISSGVKHDSLNALNYSFLIIAVLLFLFIKIFFLLTNFNRTQFKKSISKYLSDKKDLDENTIRSITNDLNYV